MPQHVPVVLVQRRFPHQVATLAVQIHPWLPEPQITGGLVLPVAAGLQVQCVQLVDSKVEPLAVGLDRLHGDRPREEFHRVLEVGGVEVCDFCDLVWRFKVGLTP